MPALHAVKDPHEAFQVLSRLLTDPRMQDVWQELLKKARVAENMPELFFYPARTSASDATRFRKMACELREKGGSLNERDARLHDAEARVLELDPPIDPTSAQNSAIRTLFCMAYRTALDTKPVFRADILARAAHIRKISGGLRKYADALQSYDMMGEAKKLRSIADDFDEAVSSKEPGRSIGTSKESYYAPRADDPWLIIRQRGEPKIRAFVADLSTITGSVFGKTLYGTLATLANVVFNCDHMSAEKVHEMLRSEPQESPDPGV